MPSFKNIKVTPEQRIKAKREWDEYLHSKYVLNMDVGYFIDPNIDPVVCACLGNGPMHYAKFIEEKQ
jgi:hypothetical protein